VAVDYSGLSDVQFLYWLRNRLLFVYRVGQYDPMVVRLEETIDRMKEEQ